MFKYNYMVIKNLFRTSNCFISDFGIYDASITLKFRFRNFSLTEWI